jgi:hypothetical protein
MTARPPVNRLITAAQPNTNGIMSGQTEFMPRLEWMWEERNRTVALLISAAVILAIAIVDWWTKPYVRTGMAPHRGRLSNFCDLSAAGGQGGLRADSNTCECLSTLLAVRRSRPLSQSPSGIKAISRCKDTGKVIDYKRATQKPKMSEMGTRLSG